MRLSLAVPVFMSAVAVFAQSPEQPLTLTRPAGKVEAALRLPASPRRPPVVCLLSASDTTELSTALAAAGVASLRLDSSKTDLDTAAQWIALLRNDERFPTVTMFGDGAQIATSVIAARAARADGLVTRGDTTPAAAELGRVLAKTATTAGPSVAEDATRIAAFAKTVPALGRRGTNPTRTQVRRSPRQVLIASVGSTRVSIEWGAPQKRDRDIWGALVPWNEEWSPGSDEAAVIATDGPITIGTLQVPAGDHTFFALPAADKFELIVSNDVGQFHTQHDASKHLGRVEMKMTERADSVEGLTYVIEGGLLKLSWDKREYSVTIAGGKVP